MQEQLLILKKNGWIVNLLTLTQGQPDEKTKRINEWTKAANELAIDNYEILDLPNNPWEKVMNNNIVIGTTTLIVLKTLYKHQYKNTNLQFCLHTTLH